MNNISGNRYGKLTALEFSYMKNGHPFWKCKCRRKRGIDMIIKTKRFYVNGKSCKVEFKKEGSDYLVVVDGNVYAKTPNELYAVQKFNEI